MRIRHIVICGLPGCTKFSHTILKKKSHDFRKENVNEQAMCIVRFSTTFVPNIPHSEKN